MHCHAVLQDMVSTIHVQMLIQCTANRNIMTGMVNSKSCPGHGAVSGNLLLDFNETTSLVYTVNEKKNPNLERMEINYGYLSTVQEPLARLQ